MTTRAQSTDLPIGSELMCSMVEVSEENISDDAQTTDVAAKASPNLNLVLSYAHCGRVSALCQQPLISADDRAEIAAQYSIFRNRVATGELEDQVDAWNEYRSFVRNMEEKYPKVIGTSRKYYSSIMEEMLTLVSRAHTEAEIERLGLQDLPLGLGSFVCAIRVTATQLGRLIADTKQIDFGLVLQLEGREDHIPLVGFEVKKYLDKTMYTTVLNTVSSLRWFRPKCFFGAAAEDENRGEDVVGQSEIWDREYILSGQRRKNSDLHPILAEKFGHFKQELLSKLSAALLVVADELAKQNAKAESSSPLKKPRHLILIDRLLGHMEQFESDFAGQLTAGLQTAFAAAMQMGKKGKKSVVNTAWESAFEQFKAGLFAQLATGLADLGDATSLEKVKSLLENNSALEESQMLEVDIVHVLGSGDEDSQSVSKAA